MKAFMTSIFIFTIASAPYAQTPRLSRHAIFVDNDVFLGEIGLRRLDRDQNYTMGVGFFCANNTMGRRFYFKPLHIINRLFNQQAINTASNMHSLLLANGSFTPDNLQASAPVKNDRPYGSLTIIQTGVTGFAENRNGERKFKQIKTASFAIGIIGTRLAEAIQTAFHKGMNKGNSEDPFNPEGWPNQISEPWEPTFGYSLQHDFLLGKEAKISKPSGWGLQAKTGYKYYLGYNTGINALFQFRTGLINKLAWFNDMNNLQSVNQLSLMQRINEIKANKEIDTGFMSLSQEQPRVYGEVFLFGGIRPHFVLYNALLNGQFRKSIHTINFQNMRHLIVEFDGGLGITIPYAKKTQALEVRLRLSGRSPEFELPGRSPKWHYWGGLELACFRIH